MQIVFQFLWAMAVFADTGNPLQSAMDFVEGNDGSAGKDYAGSTVSGRNDFRLPVHGGVRKPLAKDGQP